MTRSDRLPTVAAPRSPPGETAATHLRKRLPPFGDERSGLHRGLRLPWRSEKERDQAPERAVKSHMAVPQVPDAELVEAFIGQADRYTRSGLKLGDCFSRTALDLVFRYGSVLQRSAVRQALIAYISLPDVNQLSARSVRHNTFEKHLDNLLVHVLSTIAADGTVARYDRDIASLLVETAGDRPRVPIARSDDDREADMNATLRQLEHELKKALRVRD